MRGFVFCQSLKSGSRILDGSWLMGRVGMVDDLGFQAFSPQSPGKGDWNGETFSSQDFLKSHRASGIKPASTESMEFWEDANL